MKKKLNVFCVLMLVLKAAQVIIGNVMSFGENAQAFNKGWEEGRQATDISSLLPLLLITGSDFFKSIKAFSLPF